MPIANLYSLLNQPWYIHGSYAEAQMPLLLNILTGNLTGLEKSENKSPEFSAQGPKGAINLNEDEQDQQYVAVLPMKSPVYKYDQNCGPRGTKSYIAILDRLENDSQVAGVVLDVDSGGGQVYGTPEFYDRIKSFSKPITAYTDGYMCSAAYYFSSATDHIVANKRADHIGSIGAYMQTVDLTGYYEKMGAKVITAYADKSTEKNKAIRELLAGDPKSYIKEELNPIVDQFITDIKEVRPGVSDKAFKGATYSGPKALKMGLVDELGTLQTAINKVFELSENKNSNPKNTMSKPNSYPNLEATLGLSEPLAANENGSFLNEEQKVAIENKISADATAIKTANDAKEKAEQELAAANEAHQTALDEVTGSNTATVAALRAAATLAGVEDLAEDATEEQINTALTAKIEELNQKPGASHTKPGANAPANDPTPSYVNKENYRKLHKR